MATDEEIDEWYGTALKLTKEAGEMVRTAMKAKKEIEIKSSYADLVTETDQNVEAFLISGLKTRFPDHRFIGEESTALGVKEKLTDAPTWIIDPVDGTMNFVHSFPYVAISIGLALNQKIILGVVYNPVLEQLYSALKGNGAFCNGHRLQVSDTKELSKALIGMETGSNREPEVMNQVIENYKNLASKVHGLRSMGSAALNMCAVASGHLDSYYEYSIHCWDIAAGKIIVEEAGGIVVDPEGKKLDIMSRRVLCASSQELAHAISAELVHIQLEKD